MMKYLFFIISTLFSVMQFSASAQTSFDLTVELEGFKSKNGKVYVGLYQDSKSWLKEIFVGKIGTITNGKSKVVFENIPKGQYAVSAFHDTNEDGKLNQAIFGIPKEPVACSRQAVGRFGPPKWENAVFDLSQDTLISLQF